VQLFAYEQHSPCGELLQGHWNVPLRVCLASYYTLDIISTHLLFGLCFKWYTLYIPCWDKKNIDGICFFKIFSSNYHGHQSVNKHTYIICHCIAAILQTCSSVRVQFTRNVATKLMQAASKT
jgi:hypothetical protein